MVVSSFSARLHHVADNQRKNMKQIKLNIMVSALAGLGLVGGITSNGLAAEKEAPSPEVQAKVSQAIKDVFPDAVIGSMAKEREDGLDLIGVGFTSKGAEIDADVTPDGILVETEQAARLETFPKPAAKALKKATKGMKRSFEIFPDLCQTPEGRLGSPASHQAG